MRRKTYLTVALVLLASCSVAFWLNAHDQSLTEALMREGAPSWELDADQYRFVGVQSMNGGIVVHRWEHLEGLQTGVIDATFVEGLVCHSKRNNNSGQYQNFGCVHYPDWAGKERYPVQSR